MLPKERKQYKALRRTTDTTTKWHLRCNTLQPYTFLRTRELLSKAKVCVTLPNIITWALLLQK